MLKRYNIKLLRFGMFMCWIHIFNRIKSQFKRFLLHSAKTLNIIKIWDLAKAIARSHILHIPHNTCKFKRFYLKFIYWTCSPMRSFTIHTHTIWYGYCSFWNGRFLTFSRLERKNRENILSEIHRMLLMTWNGNEWVWALVVFFFFLFGH